MPILIQLHSSALSPLQRIFSTAILITLCCVYTFAEAETLYKWVDRDGNVSYQEVPPPTAAISQKVIQTKDSGDSEAVSLNTGKAPILVYTLKDCNSCVDVLLRLENFGVPVTESSLLERDAQARLLELGGQLAAPSVFVGDKLISDFSTENLITELESAGYILKKENADLAPDESRNRLVPKQASPDN